MAQRYFIELQYKGTHYAGFQTQQNAATIQGKVETALQTYYRQPFQLTGSSRTDAGVHARQNYFHFDATLAVTYRDIYHLNALLPRDIVIKNIVAVHADAHSRFDAVYRKYRYHLHQLPDPFIVDYSWYYPFPVNEAQLNDVAQVLLAYEDFTSFSKRNTQTKTMICQLQKSKWERQGNGLVYEVQGNRFLRGMVKALVGTMLQVARGKITLDKFRDIISAKDCTLADFSPPSHGLFLEQVAFSDGYFQFAENKGTLEL